MDQAQTSKWIGLLTLAIVAAALAMGVHRFQNGDVAFCRRAFTDLAKGRQSVQRRIDWEHFRALDTNIGVAYAALPNDRERADYRDAFVSQFAQGFQSSGSRAQTLSRWKVQERADGHTVVAGSDETGNLTLLFQIPQAGRKRLEAIQWK